MMTDGASLRDQAEQWRFPWGNEPLLQVLKADWKANPRDPGSLLLLSNLRISQYLIGRFGRHSIPGVVGMALCRGINEGFLGVELRPATRVAPGLSVYHRFGIVVNNDAVIGRGVHLRHGVTIGHKTSEGRSPVIEKGVDIGAGAIIVGDITIGEYAKIAAGAVVVKDVPKGATVAGNPARVINSTS